MPVLAGGMPHDLKKRANPELVRKGKALPRLLLEAVVEPERTRTRGPGVVLPSAPAGRALGDESTRGRGSQARFSSFSAESEEHSGSQSEVPPGGSGEDVKLLAAPLAGPASRDLG